MAGSAVLCACYLRSTSALPSSQAAQAHNKTMGAGASSCRPQHERAANTANRVTAYKSYRRGGGHSSQPLESVAAVPVAQGDGLSAEMDDDAFDAWADHVLCQQSRARYVCICAYSCSLPPLCAPDIELRTAATGIPEPCSTQQHQLHLGHLHKCTDPGAKPPACTWHVEVMGEDGPSLAEESIGKPPICSPNLLKEHAVSPTERSARR